jgi:2-iminobutanoate/2-iminopropanoate deaminase
VPRFFNPRRIAPPGSRYSHGVAHSARAHRLVISGQVGIRPDGSVAKDLEEQMEVAWDNLIEVLREGGMGVSDIVKITTFVTAPGSVALARKVRQRKLGLHAPASTYLEVAGLASPEFLFEVEAEAVSEDPATIFDEMGDEAGVGVGTFRTRS